MSYKNPYFWNVFVYLNVNTIKQIENYGVPIVDGLN